MPPRDVSTRAKKRRSARDSSGPFRAASASSREFTELYCESTVCRRLLACREFSISTNVALGEPLSGDPIGTRNGAVPTVNSHARRSLSMLPITKQEFVASGPSHSSASVAVQIRISSSITGPIGTDRRRLLHQEHAWARTIGLKKIRKVPRHGLEIVGDENSILLGGDSQDVWIGKPLQHRLARREEVHRRFSAQATSNDPLI